MTAEHGRSTNRLGMRRTRGLRLCATLALLGSAAVTTGCKLGSTSFSAPSFSKPSWWTSNGSSKADAAGLASAPPFGNGSGDVKKPSETAKPYPVTSTPSGYVINESTAAPAVATAQAAAPQSPVVYGTTPPPAAAASVAAAPPATAPASTPASVAPQVGPYSTLAGETIPPPGQPLPPLAPSQMAPAPSQGSAFAAGAAVDGAPTASRFGAAQPQPAESALPSTAYTSAAGNPAASMAAEPPAARMADARGGDPAAGFPAGGVPAEQASYGGSRYASAPGSRFGGAAADATLPAAAAGAAAYGQPPAGTFPTSMPNTQVPGASPLVPPPAAPGLLQPSTAPVRRPDPVYRPGGTSSYRPNQAILADDAAPPADAAVRAASYDAPVSEMIRQ